MNENVMNDLEFEKENTKKINKLLKSLEYNDWVEALEDNVLKETLNKHRDSNGNNIYQIFFKVKRDNDALFKISKLVELLIKNNISTLGLNIQNKTAYEMAEDKSTYSMNLIKAKYEEEQFIHKYKEE